MPSAGTLLSGKLNMLTLVFNDSLTPLWVDDVLQHVHPTLKYRDTRMQPWRYENQATLFDAVPFSKQSLWTYLVFLYPYNEMHAYLMLRDLYVCIYVNLTLRI